MFHVEVHCRLMLEALARSGEEMHTSEHKTNSHTHTYPHDTYTCNHQNDTTMRCLPLQDMEPGTVTIGTVRDGSTGIAKICERCVQVKIHVHVHKCKIYM